MMRILQNHCKYFIFKRKKCLASYLVRKRGVQKKHRPHEELAKNICQHGVINRQFYVMMQDNPEIAESFKKKAEYIRLVMGTEENIYNYLNLGYFTCLVKS